MILAFTCTIIRTLVVHPLFLFYWVEQLILLCFRHKERRQMKYSLDLVNVLLVTLYFGHLVACLMVYLGFADKDKPLE